MKFTKKALKEINTKDNNFKNMVKNYLLNYGCTKDVESHMEDIVTYGCQSGCVGFAIYCSENEATFKKYCIDIMDIVRDYQENVGQIHFELNIDNLVWFAIEETTREFLNELYIEY